MSQNSPFGRSYPGITSGFRPINPQLPQQDGFQTLNQQDKFQQSSLDPSSSSFTMTPFENDTVQMSNIQMNQPKPPNFRQTPYQQLSYQQNPFQLTSTPNPTRLRPTFQQAPVQQTPVQDTQFHDTLPPELLVEVPTFQFTDLDMALSQQTDFQQTPVQESLLLQTPVQESLSQQIQAQGSLVSHTPVPITPAQDPLASQSPIQQQPTPTHGDITAQDISAQHTSNKDVLNSEIPSRETSTRETPSQETPSRETPSQEAPSQEVRTQGASSLRALSQEKASRKRSGPKPKTWKPSPWQPYGPQPRDRYSYPDKSPLKQGTAKPCDHWYRSAVSNPIFVKEVPDVAKEPEHYQLVYEEKMLHLQTYFWPALDKANRKSAEALGRPTSSGTWGYRDMIGMLVWYRLIFQVRFEAGDPEVQADGMWTHMVLSSPWWDCPELQDMVYEDVVDGEGKIRRNIHNEPIKRRRDGREKERAFLEFWGPNIAKLPLRRFPDGTMVMSTNYDRFRSIYGAWAALWPHQRNPWYFDM